MCGFIYLGLRHAFSTKALHAWCAVKFVINASRFYNFRSLDKKLGLNINAYHLLHLRACFCWIPLIYLLPICQMPHRFWCNNFVLWVNSVEVETFLKIWQRRGCVWMYGLEVCTTFKHAHFCGICGRPWSPLICERSFMLFVCRYQ